MDPLNAGQTYIHYTAEVKRPLRPGAALF